MKTVGCGPLAFAGEIVFHVPTGTWIVDLEVLVWPRTAVYVPSVFFRTQSRTGLTNPVAVADGAAEAAPGAANNPTSVTTTATRAAREARARRRRAVKDLRRPSMT